MIISFKLTWYTILKFSALLLASLLSSCAAATPAPTLTPPPTETPLPTRTPSPSATASPSPTLTPSTTPTRTPTRTPRPPTLTPTRGAPTATATPVTVWNGVPILPGADSGKDDGKTYSYTTTSSIIQVDGYYRREMPEFGWRLASAGLSNSPNRMLIFKQGDQMAVIAILTDPLYRYRTLVIISANERP